VGRREFVTPFRTNTSDDEVVPDHIWLMMEPQSERRPWSPLQALMEAAPFDEPEVSQLERLALRDVLADALDDLPPRDRRFVEARIIERRSYRSLENELGWKKSHMQRHEQRLMRRLAAALEDHPAIQTYLARHDTPTETE